MKSKRRTINEQLLQRFAQACARALRIAPDLAEGCADQFLHQVLENLVVDDDSLKRLLGPTGSQSQE